MMWKTLSFVFKKTTENIQEITMKEIEVIENFSKILLTVRISNIYHIFKTFEMVSFNYRDVKFYNLDHKRNCN